MKKTLIALAALAASGAVFAQSSVTLSGAIDVGFQKRFSGDPVSMTGDRNGTSNWTVRGVEDLGGGLKAVFQVSTSFNPDTGTAGNATTGTNNALGNNGMFVGVEGNFGRLIAGRPAHLLWTNVLSANGTKGVSAHATSSVLGGTATGGGLTSKTGGALSAVYIDNAIQYFSPRFAGVQVQLEYAPKEAVAGNDAFAVALNYGAGPVALTLTNSKAAGTALPKLKSVTQLGAAYDFGVARVLFTYRDQSGAAANADTSYALGVTAPIGAGSVYASYNVNEQAGDDGRTVIAGYKYNLSKRTQAYAQVANRNAAWIPGSTKTGSSNGYGFGLLHNF
jgi:predicted porin